jgi:hypothetical protein
MSPHLHPAAGKYGCTMKKNPNPANGSSLMPSPIPAGRPSSTRSNDELAARAACLNALVEDAAHLGARHVPMWTGVTALMPFVDCGRIGHSKELGKGSVDRVHSNGRRSAVCVI